MSTQTLFTVIAFNGLVLALPVAALVLWFRPQWWLHLWTLFVGILIGLMDLRATEVQMTVFLLIAFGFFAGFSQPRRAWRWALLLAIWVPIFAAIASAIRLTNSRGADIFVALATIAFALIGAYAGVLVKRLSQPAQETTPN